MLSFLRENSIKIVYGIIISFVVTTFMGVVFFNNSFQDSKNVKQQQISRESAIAMIGDLPVDRQVFLLEFRREQASIPENVQINNNLIENIQIQALNRAIEKTLFLELGKDQKLKASRSEINTSLYSVMEQYGVSSKKELKSSIEMAGGSYEAMLYQMKNDIIASKIQQALINSVQLNDLDKEHFNHRFLFKELLISNRSTDNSRLDDEVVYNKASEVRARISDSQSFSIEREHIYKEYDVPLSVTPNWLTINQINPDLARSIYEMNIKEISQPIRTKNGYYILELLDKEIISDDQVLTSEALIKDWQTFTIYSYLSDALKGREVKILDPNLNALNLKSQGRFDEAIEAYQGAISQDPSNPYPNLLIAQIYLLKGEISNAKQSLLKGEIKETLMNDGFIIPEIHLLLASIYNQEGFSSKRDDQYDKLINNENTSEGVLNFLKKVFEDSRDNYRLAKVNQLIKESKITANIVEDLNSLSSDEDIQFLKELNTN